MRDFLRQLGSGTAFVLYQGTTLVVPPAGENSQGFTGCGKTLFFEGYGLQPVYKRLKTGAALAAEGRIFIRLPTFSAASKAVP